MSFYRKSHWGQGLI